MTWNEWLSQWVLGQPIRLPKEVAEQPWEPVATDRAAAWSLYTELRTRITCQPLHYLAGDEKTALETVAALFKQSRELIHKHGPESRHFATLTVHVLNHVVRPFTAKWHKAVTDGTFNNEDVRHKFREALNSLQMDLRQFATVLGALAEANAFVPGSESWPVSRPDHDQILLGNAIPFNVLFDQHVPDEQQLKIRCHEHNEIRSRRSGVSSHAAAVGSTPPPLPPEDKRETDVAGLAISGGGLRSATFALGVVQGLAEKRMLGQFDYLSTVSGGGYIGSFLSSYLNSPRKDVGSDGVAQLPFRKPAVGESAALRHLRAHSKFLLTGGLLGRLMMVLHALYGMFANIVILLAWLVTLLLAIDILDQCGVLLNDQTIRQVAKPDANLTVGLVRLNWVIGVWLGVGVLMLCMPLVLRLARMHGRASVIKVYQRATAIYNLVAVVTTMILLVPLLFYWENRLWQQRSTWVASNLTWLGVLALLQRIGTSLTWIKTGNRWVQMLANTLLIISGPLFFFILFVAIGHWFLVSDSPPTLNLFGYSLGPHGTLSLLAVTLLVYSHVLLDINQSSLHPFYRDRLSEAYLIQPSETAAEPDRVQHQDRQLLSQLGRNNPSAPYHLLNAAVNSPAGQHPSLRGRKSDMFVFSRWFCGCGTTGYYETETLEQLDPHLDLGTAVAISGAAASPFMGTRRTPASILFAMLNIRLDYWLPLPDRRRLPIVDSSPGPWYLFRQVLGWVNERSAYVNLSDGGHIENLGLYELLRRRCKFIVAIDGECDPDITCGSLVNLQRFVRTDFGIELDLDLSRVKKAADGTVPFHFLLATIDYTPDVPEKDEKLLGHLLYLKSSVTGNEAPPIARYRADKPEFSHESTADLFYDEAQFEAYRSLGHHIAMEVFRKELIGSQSPSDIRTWFARLVAHLRAPEAQ